MIIRSTIKQFDETALRTRIPVPENCLFFDIETTGFKPDQTHLYLICLAERVSDGWKITQLFGEKPSEEAAILRTFAQLVRPYSQMMTFNGELFDIGYLTEKYTFYGLENPLASLESVDLYRNVRTLRRFLGMTHMNQKSLEEYLGLHREDPYDGGQLIAVYREYVKTQSEDLLETLLLHNFEDVCGMFTVTRLFAYLAALESVPEDIHASILPGSPEYLWGADDAAPFSVEPAVAAPAPGHALIQEVYTLVISFPLSVPIPVPAVKVPKKYPIRVRLQDHTGEIAVPLAVGRFLYFLTPVREYYYLPEEDEAIHRNVAIYADQAHRVKASPQNCYTHQAGAFIPSVSDGAMPVFRRTYKDPVGWVRLPDDFENNQEFLTEYAVQILRCVI